MENAASLLLKDVNLRSYKSNERKNPFQIISHFHVLPTKSFGSRPLVSGAHMSAALIFMSATRAPLTAVQDERKKSDTHCFSR